MNYFVYAVVVGVALVLYAVSHRHQIQAVYGTQGLAWFAIECAALCLIFACLGLFVTALGLLHVVL